MAIQIFDNFLPKEDHKKLKDYMMSFNFPWFYMNSVTEDNDQEKEYYFIHHFLNLDGIKSDWYYLLESLLIRINVKKWLRIKGNLYPNVNIDVENINHRDYTTFNHAAIYSINSNNGGTIILENGKENLISSKENRIVFFDGSQLHRSKYCTDEKIRVNINMNFL